MVRTPTKVLVIVYALKDDGCPRYLVLRTNASRGNFWQPVTGGVESGEKIDEAAERECEEETGLTIVGQAVRLHYTHRFAISAGKAHRYPPGSQQIEEHALAVRVTPAEPVLDPDEHDDFRWCEFEEAEALIYWKENRQALRRAHEMLTRGRHKPVRHH